MNITISTRPVVFSKFFSAADVEAVLAAIPAETRKVVFVDTPATPHMVAVVEELLTRGVEVIVRDHHDVPAPRNPREQEIADAANRVRALLGERALISDRQAHPACSSLVELGEFVGEGTVIVADPDPDGLTAAMKAVGLTYPELDSDAAIMDGARSEQTAERLSPVALLLVKGMATLPPFNPERPELSEKAKAELFAEFVAAVSGDAAALERLNRKVEAYEAGVTVAKELLTKVQDLGHGVVMVDTVGAPRHDLVTLTQGIESRPGCRITVVRKDNGPIAAAEAKAGRPAVQISLAVVKAFQKEINLQDYLPEGFVSSPESGIISNTSFLLHLSEQKWEELVKPALLS